MAIYEGDLQWQKGSGIGQTIQFSC